MDPKEVKRARGEEIGYMVKRGIWKVRPTTECWERLGKAQVSVRWVDTLKSDGVRSRLVARDFKGGDNDRDDMFAATLTRESKRMLLSKAATGKNGKLTRKLFSLMAKRHTLTLDVKRMFTSNSRRRLAESLGSAVSLLSGFTSLGRQLRCGRSRTPKN